MLKHLPPNALAIHIIGPGLGESIVVEFPNRQVGVIDAYSSDLQATGTEAIRDANPTFRFLDEVLKPKELQFLAYTHPHEDHGRGFRQILTAYSGRIRELWLFDSWDSHALGDYFTVCAKNDERLPIERALNEVAGTFCREFLHTCEAVHSEFDRYPGVLLREFNKYSAFKIDNEDVFAHILGPHPNELRHHRKQMAASLKRAINPATLEMPKDWESKDVNANEFSPAILLVYGTTSVMLGGDMESNGWQRILNEQSLASETRPPLAVTLLKVSHHGSSNGYCAGIYGQFARRRPFLAVLTPFKKGRPLPEVAGLTTLSGFASQILCTNLNQAYGSVGKRIVAKRPTTLSSKWLPALSVDATWASYLHPSLVSSPVASRAAGIPLEMLTFLRHNPELITELNDEYIDEILPANDTVNAIRDCRITIYLDRHGNEISTRRFVGAKAGVYD